MATAVPDLATPAGEPPVAEVAASTIEGLHILLVDDEADTREMLPIVLSRFGVRVTTASSAEEALQTLERNPVDLLVADIGMPGEDGYDLIRKVRSGRHAHLPAIALTAYASEVDRGKTLAAGYQLHLAKPVEARDLVAALASLADGARQALS